MTESLYPRTSLISFYNRNCILKLAGNLLQSHFWESLLARRGGTCIFKPQLEATLAVCEWLIGDLILHIFCVTKSARCMPLPFSEEECIVIKKKTLPRFQRVDNLLYFV